MAKRATKAAHVSSASVQNAAAALVPRSARGQRAPSKLIDPAVRRAVQAEPDKPLTVMVKFDPKISTFGQYPVSNRQGSARERTFNKEVNAVVEGASGGSFKVISTAANLGVATVETSARAVWDLLLSSKITGVKLKQG
ncbi:hypothetical protein [Burkholderia multivorans]|uniref:hypothetical protein n=1 Tax=Burkholderiaceae TaxID=119060 RepID=UPI0012699C9D|nr:hypothetical protein [Burkholderia multivorans]HDR9473302.1 hypothetical protein [Burkholderia multivorans]